MSEILLGFRFGVFFLSAGDDLNPLDIRFQRVGGLSTTVHTTQLSEGGQNLYQHHLPTGVLHENLVLQRGMVVGSPLTAELNDLLSTFQFRPSNVMVILFNQSHQPVAAWLFNKAFPVEWRIEDLDATQESVLIDKLVLSYARMQVVRV